MGVWAHVPSSGKILVCFMKVIDRCKFQFYFRTEFLILSRMRKNSPESGFRALFFPYCSVLSFEYNTSTCISLLLCVELYVTFRNKKIPALSQPCLSDEVNGFSLRFHAAHFIPHSHIFLHLSGALIPACMLGWLLSHLES